MTWAMIDIGQEPGAPITPPVKGRIAAVPDYISRRENYAMIAPINRE